MVPTVYKGLKRQVLLVHPKGLMDIGTEMTVLIEKSKVREHTTAKKMLPVRALPLAQSTVSHPMLEC